MLTKKMFKLVAVTSILTSVLCGGLITSASADMRSSKEIVKEMGIGWNLGNTLDAYTTNLSYYSSPQEAETCWGNPVTTKAMIDKIKQSGFKTIRIPVTWGPHIGSAPEYKVADSWMNRVKEVVDYAISDGLYVILNVHHDSDWCTPTYNAEKNATVKLNKLWTQIANKFKNYDDHLIFETLNEPRVIGSPEEWSGGTHEGRDVVNRYNQAALNTIRATGGNNADRSVMVPTYAAACYSTTVNDFKIPNDSHIIVSIHAYNPYGFAMATKGQDYYTNTWGSFSDKQSLDSDFNYYYDSFVKKGVPVVIGEFGSINKNNTQSRVEHAKYFVTSALKRDMACVWWDNNISVPDKEETFGIFNRANLSWYSPEVKDALISAYTSVRGNNSNNQQNQQGQQGTTTTTVPGNTAKLQDGWYYIKNVNAQKYLQVTNNTGKAAQNIELGTGTGFSGQKWYLKNVTDGYITLQSALGDFMVDIANAKNQDGANVQIYNSHSGTAQQFMLKTTSTSGAYVIATKCSNLTKVLDDYEFKTTDGTNVCQWTYGGKSNQQWIFESVNNSGSNTGSGTTAPASKLDLDYNISDWGSAYQITFKVLNKTNADVSNWTLKLKKSEVNISSSWSINVKESGDYYIITPMSYNSYLSKGGCAEFGIQGKGSAPRNLNYTLN